APGGGRGPARATGLCPAASARRCPVGARRHAPGGTRGSSARGPDARHHDGPRDAPDCAGANRVSHPGTRRGSMMERIDSEIRRELTRFGAPGGMPELLAAWPESVGPEIARNAWPARAARDGTLHVSTSSSAWSFELTQLAPEIMRRLSERLGEDAPR